MTEEAREDRKEKSHGFATVGHAIPSVDGIMRATGSAVYAVDVSLPNMLHGKVLRSPHAHARILHIDVSRAERLKGVRAVITGRDTPMRKSGGLPMFPETVDEYGLAVDKVRYVGDEVAAVAAQDEETAQEALDLIRVEYEVLPAVFDPLEAMEEGAPLIHEVPGNIAFEGEMEFGDVEGGFREAHHIREDEFTTPMLSHCALEPHASVASVSPSGKITVWSSTQSPYFVQKDLAQLVGVSLDRVRVIKTFVGGAFGGKIEALAPEFCSTILSMKTRRPVKIVYTREEEFVTTRHRHPTIIKLKTGVRNDGTIVAKECLAIMDGGAYNSFGPGIFGRIGGQISLVYRVPNMKFKGYLVYTNKPVCGAMRGVTNFQARFADDSQMDMIAEDLGLDPLEIRIRNARGPGETTAHGWKVTSCGLRECLQKIDERRKTVKREDAGEGWRVGVGISCWGYYSGARVGHGGSEVFIKLNEEGVFILTTGGSDIGQGLNTVLSQMAAEELGVSLERVRVVSGDTDFTPMDLGSWLSRTTYFTGNAVLEAAREVKGQIIDTAAEMLHVDKAQLQCKDNTIRDDSAPDKNLRLEEVGRYALFQRKKGILGRGYYDADLGPSNPKTGVGNASPAYAFGAVMAEVQVNEGTGQVILRRISSATDCGYPINPLTASGQIEGALVMGMGAGLYEELKVDKGKVLNPSFLDYKIPRATDAPRQETFLIETEEKGGPFGAKGIAEGAAIPMAPAINNAIHNAVGKRFKCLPITPEMILQALEDSNSG